MNSGCIIIRTSHRGTVWTVPELLMKEFALRVRDPVVLKCGAASARALVTPLNHAVDKTPVTGLSGAVLNALGIPENTSFLIKSEGGNVFRLGPVIGILTFPGHIPHRLGYYKMYARRIKAGLVYVFRSGNIKPDQHRIYGHYYDRVQSAWKAQDLPYPDAVMDRCYPNPYIAHRLLERVMGPGKIFNKKSMIDKVAFYKVLSDDSELKEFVPETLVFQQAEDLETFLRRWSEVFLKPTNAMKGTGIVVVSKTNNGKLLCRYSIKGAGLAREISSPDDIFDVMIKAAGHMRPYIIQQGIPRMTYKGGPFSFRTWAMKNGQGRWVMPGMFAKGTFGQGFLTNFTAGAKLIPLRELFEEILPQLPYTKDSLLMALEDLTLKTAAALDKKYGPLGELGLDIVFDLQGKPWLIEANGNPGNIPVFIQKEYPLWPNLIFQYPIDYAAYLAGFTEHAQNLIRQG